MRRRDQLSILLLAMLMSGVIAACAQPGGLRQSARPMALEEAREFFACRTLMSFDPGHGTQVYYMRPDGTEFLWYPGNAVVLASKWRFTQRVPDSPQLGVDLCFQYATNTYNPMTKQQGGQWECRAAQANAYRVVERATGDIFGLSRRLPFVLSRERTSLEALQQQLRTLRPEEPRDAADEQGCPRQTS
jgi:hypothetical protein